MIETAPVSKVTLPFDIAWMYVLLLDYDNKKDWRLPTFDEILENDSLQVGVWTKEYISSSPDYSKWFKKPVTPVRTKDV